MASPPWVRLMYNFKRDKKTPAPPRGVWPHLFVTSSGSNLECHTPAASCPCDAWRQGGISLLPLIRVCSPAWAGGTFIPVFSQSYIHANHCLFPLCTLCSLGGNEYTASDMWTLHDKTHSRHSAPLMAHWGEIAGFLPHRDQMQVQGSTAEPELQRRTTITAHFPKYYQRGRASKVEEYSPVVRA